MCIHGNPPSSVRGYARPMAWTERNVALFGLCAPKTVMWSGLFLFRAAEVSST